MLRRARGRGRPRAVRPGVRGHPHPRRAGLRGRPAARVPRRRPLRHGAAAGGPAPVRRRRAAAVRPGHDARARGGLDVRARAAGRRGPHRGDHGPRRAAQDGALQGSEDMERGVPESGESCWDRAREHPGNGAGGDVASGVPNERDPARAARALGGAQLRPLGLHLQLRQDVPRPPGPPPPRPRPRRHGPALHALLLPPPHPGDTGGLRGPPRREAEPDRRRRRARGCQRQRGGPHPAAAGRAHCGRSAAQRPRGRAVPRGVAGRLRLRPAVQPDGGRGYGGDQPRPELAVAAPRSGAGRRRCGGARDARATRTRRRGGDGEGRGRGRPRQVPKGAVRGGGQDLQPAVHRAGAGRLPHAGRVQPHRGAPSRCVTVQALNTCMPFVAVESAFKNNTSLSNAAIEIRTDDQQT
ncbi:malate synthase1 [Zea mays]|uniref:Malate synthase1 n=1 Tax=Zea mays TaxID=4577 RepID=A0A1D6E7W0_MAIZE|nr:malate synthase1 [Zea mays]